MTTLYYTMTTLYLEVIASIVAAALVGLIVGWMIRAARARRQFDRSASEWTRNTEKLEAKHSTEIDALESKLELTAADVQKLTKQNRELQTLTTEGETSVDKARSDAIDLNRKQSELLDRLQRNIRHKDREIAALKVASDPATQLQATATAELSPPAEQASPQHSLNQLWQPSFREEAYVDRLANRGHRLPASETPALDEQQTLHNAGGEIPDDEFDETIVIEKIDLHNDPEFLETRADTVAMPDHDESFVDTLDSTETAGTDVTIDSTIDGLEEATVALDPETLTRARNRR